MRTSRTAWALSSVLILAACGDDDTGTGGGGGSTSATTGATTSTSTTTTSSSGNPTAGGGDPGSGGQGAGDVGGGPGSGGSGAGDAGGGDAGGGDAGGGTSAPCCYGAYIAPQPQSVVAAAAPVAESGTRLRTRWLEGGGARIFQGFRDLDLDLDCAFNVASDGAMRCLPDGDDTGGAYLYLDSDCTQLVYVENACKPGVVPTHVSTFEVDDATEVCEPFGRYRYFEVQQAVDAATLYYSNGPGTCIAQDNSVTAYAVSATETPPATFAAATIETEVVAGPLDLRALVSADGASQVWIPVDETYGPCNYDGYDDPRCAPVYQPSTGYQAFTDAACTDQVPDVVVDPRPDSCDPPTALRTYDAGACTVTYAAPESTEAAYVRDGDACVAGDAAVAYASGDTIARSSFVDIAYVGVGPGRLQATRFALGDQPLATNGVAWDSELDATCDPYLLAGALRCVPSRRHAIDGVYYGDAACTQPVMPGYVAEGCEEMDYYGIEDQDSSCSSAPFQALYRRGQPFVSDVAYYLDGERCVSLPVPEGTPLYEATEVAPEDLVTLDVALD